MHPGRPARLLAGLGPAFSRDLLERGANPNVYPFGYLFHADTLCFWDRERIQVTDLVHGEDTAVPGCAL